VRGDQQLTKASSNPKYGEYKGSLGYFLGFFMFLSTGFALVLNPRRRNLGGKAESACEEFEDNEGGMLVC